MPLHAPQFFAELCLPFTDSTVVGNTYYATPVAGAALRLRISFSETIYADTYGGLHMAVVHPDRGKIDSVALSFADHGTFHRRDEALNTPLKNRNYGTFNTAYHRPDQPPWEGAVTARLRDAIEQYTEVWFPGAWGTPTPSRAAARTVQKTPAPPASRTASRTR
ncbi:hypothetical protein M8I34_20550 [Streptomyces sp. MCA2]|uniref:hypothetical protein n=1 Tax=Streptomyces sp. MCA2 TaxID=2944805 RepID=UPI0020217F2B|nr:hypothetical protein [Streptomyces sp. MCA2]MCL7493770.1 hypothetical protein [Streptomyces sp. MCA2]